MEEQFKLVSRVPDGGPVPGFLLPENAEKVRSFHQTIPGYAPTPLVSLRDTAKELGVGKIWVKDESKRVGLNAFKVLGGSYAMGRLLTERLGLEHPDFPTLTTQSTREQLGDITFVTATDGNHGRGVAWSAAQFGQKSVVYMPFGSAPERLENIRSAGASADIIDGNYDDTVRLAARQAAEKGWLLVQDTAWEGYTRIPVNIRFSFLIVRYVLSIENPT